jgi:hypothetical protein
LVGKAYGQYSIYDPVIGRREDINKHKKHTTFWWGNIKERD